MSPEQEGVDPARPAAQQALQPRVGGDAARGDPHDRVAGEGSRAAAEAEERQQYNPISDVFKEVGPALVHIKIEVNMTFSLRKKDNAHLKCACLIELSN